jgi:kynurenine formamidase
MIYDLTIPLDENTFPFPDSGDPHMTWKHLVDHNVYKCQVSLFSMVTHLGTHIDAPLHFIRNGKTTAEVDLAKYCNNAVCFDITAYIKGCTQVDIRPILEKNKDLIRSEDIIVLRTGWEEKVGTPEYFDFPDFDETVGEALEKYGASGIAFDMPSIDRAGIAHQAVLGRDMSIIESLVNLKPLVGRRFYLSAAPLKFADGDGSPVRAYAIAD